MLDVFNFPTPQNSNYQEFHFCGGGSGSSQPTSATWIKPRGASMVRFMLIGAGGGGGDGTTSLGGGGGGSGAITSWIGPAIFIPDSLIVKVGKGGAAGAAGGLTAIYYRGKDSNEYELLRANNGTSGTAGAITAGTGGAAMTNNYFGAAGIFTSIAGQNGANGSSSSTGGSITASSTTFLSGGAGGSGGSTTAGGAVTPNYGYPALPQTPSGGIAQAADGYFIKTPILVGTGGAGGCTDTVGSGSPGGRGGIGCGGGGSGEDALQGGRGGDGAVFIWSW